MTRDNGLRGFSAPRERSGRNRKTHAIPDISFTNETRIRLPGLQFMFRDSPATRSTTFGRRTPLGVHQMWQNVRRPRGCQSSRSLAE